VGGVAGAITALLLAPKSGSELRRDIADTSSEFYGKASDYFKQVEGKVEETMKRTMNEGKAKAQSIIDSAKRQAQDLISGAESVLAQAKTKAIDAKDSISHNYDAVKEAAKAGAEAFKSEMRASKGGGELE